MADSDYTAHITRLTNDIESMVEEMPCQPILFIGSGISLRYFDGPSWTELLEELADRCPKTDRTIGYFLQRGDSEEEIGSELSDDYYEWAYDSGQDRFPDELYDEQSYGKNIFLKYEVSKYFQSITPESLEDIDEEYQEEIGLLQEIQPHAIITTNYDTLLETLFPDYKPIVGEEILQSPHQNIGEIYKIHGCISEPEKLVLTQDDYNAFAETKKYLTAKLLTYFAEHPVLIAGYGVGDANVKRVLRDLDQILAPEDGVIENILFLQWNSQEEIAEREVFDSQRRFDLNGNRVFLNYTTANGFEWVFRAFGGGGSIEGTNLKLLRSVLANTYDVVATKAPRKEVDIEYESLQWAAESEDAMGTLFGVTLLDNPQDLNLHYRYRLSDLAERLGYETWHPAHYLIEEIEEETGVNIKEADTIYHIDIAFNRSEPDHRYSDAAVELLRKVDEGEEYELNTTPVNLGLDSHDDS